MARYLTALVLSFLFASVSFAQMCPGGKSVELYRQATLKSKKVLIALVYVEELSSDVEDAADEAPTFVEHWCELSKYKPLSASSKAIFSFAKKSAFDSFEQYQEKCLSLKGKMRVHIIDDETPASEDEPSEEE